MTDPVSYDVLPHLEVIRRTTCRELGIDEAPAIRDAISEIETLRRVVARLLVAPLVDDCGDSRTLDRIHEFDDTEAAAVRRCEQ